jgi:eukaryotic-like serine/threonine-protein kinase
VDAATALEIGSTANSYQVLARLATGGMAEIFLARSAGVAAVQRHVVLKRVLRERASDANFIRMFLDEARLAAQLQHPNIAQVYDVGKLGDSFFFTMEYVHGETVRAMLQQAHERRRSPPLGCVLAIAAGAAAGLAHAHTRIGVEGRPLGIVHRDISPSNLMVAYDGSVKVVDFGVAKAADRITETHSGAVKGKISYLSPEQARGQRVDQRSDLFSLGIVMWEMLTVERLYKHESDYDTMEAIIHEAPPPPSSRRRDVPPAMDELVLRALAKSPEQRFQTAEELGEAIERVAVQTSSPLSAAGLSRFLRELFGQRPEPWRTLAVVEQRAEIVTVTSEPIPKELQIPVSDPIDRRLAAVVDLSVSLPADAGAARGETVTVHPPAGAPRGAAAHPRAGTGTPGAPAPWADAATVTPTAPARWAEAGAAAPSTVALAAGAPARPWWRRTPLVLGALVLGVAVIVALAVAFGDNDLPRVAATEETTPPARPQGAEEANAAQSADSTEATPVPSPPEPAPVPPVAAAAAVDAAIEPEPTAAAGAPDPADSADSPSPAAKTKPRPGRTAPPRKAVDLAKELERGRHAAAVAECVANPAADRALCVRAACHAGDAPKARRWLARVPAPQQGKLVDACAALGTKLGGERRDPKPKSDCADPMDCPR